MEQSDLKFFQLHGPPSSLPPMGINCPQSSRSPCLPPQFLPTFPPHQSAIGPAPPPPSPTTISTCLIDASQQAPSLESIIRNGKSLHPHHPESVVPSGLRQRPGHKIGPTSLTPFKGTRTRWTGVHPGSLNQTHRGCVVLGVGRHLVATGHTVVQRSRPASALWSSCCIGPCAIIVALSMWWY